MVLKCNTPFSLSLSSITIIDIVKESATKSKSKTLDGLWRTMTIAARHDVSELVIPVPLIESSLPKNASADETILQLSKNVNKSF